VNTMLTQFGQIVGTPEYASPKQADTMTEEIDESPDVYSLGVLFCELNGAVPFDTATLRSAVWQNCCEAAAELQKILNYRGIVAADLIAALAHLQLGRAWFCREIRTRRRFSVSGAQKRKTTGTGRLFYCQTRLRSNISMPLRCH
jgi:serine/threonine protein kinase